MMKARKKNSARFVRGIPGQLVGYAEVAGGGTPREHRWETFRNRYQCKYNFMKFNFDKLGCTGCGRCISACPAEIDLREVIQSLQEV